MIKILLVNMPFGEVIYPSLGLTQLKSVIKEQFGSLCETKILYLNHDYAAQMGLEQYQEIVSDPTTKAAELVSERYQANAGDWLFRKLAFPDSRDNADDYFSRFFPKKKGFTEFLLEQRKKSLPRLLSYFEQYQFQDYDLIGFTSMFQQQLSTIAMARIIKDRAPHIITFAGGCNFEYPAAEIFAKRVPCLDYIFSGPGLISVPEFLNCIISDCPEKIPEIHGVYTANQDRLPQEHLTHGAERDIRQVVNLDYSEFIDSLEYHFPDGQLEPEVFFETSRGCWWGEKQKCTFCDYNGLSMAYRSMDPAQALDYLRSLKKYSDKITRFRSVDSILSRDYFTELLPCLNLQKKDHYFYETKVGHSRSEIKMLAKAGIDYIQAGIEALYTPSLKSMKKGNSVFENIQFLKDCDLYGIRVLWNLLTGIPNEDQKVYRFYLDYIHLLHHLPAPTGLWTISYDRYSDYVLHREQYHLKLHPDIEQIKYLYPFNEEELNKIAYFFVNEENNQLFPLHTMKKIRKINNLIQMWKESQARQEYPAALYFEKYNGIRLVDTRNGTCRQLLINDLDYQLLTELDQAHTVKSLHQKYPHIEGQVIENRIQFFFQNELLFREGNRIMSLVLPAKPKRLIEDTHLTEPPKSNT